IERATIEVHSPNPPSQTHSAGGFDIKGTNSQPPATGTPAPGSPSPETPTPGTPSTPTPDGPPPTDTTPTPDGPPPTDTTPTQPPPPSAIPSPEAPRMPEPRHPEGPRASDGNAPGMTNAIALTKPPAQPELAAHTL